MSEFIYQNRLLRLHQHDVDHAPRKISKARHFHSLASYCQLLHVNYRQLSFPSVIERKR